MTLIIGALCSDGVVLVGDKKVVEGIHVSIEKKIHFLDSLGVGFTGAGLNPLLDKFVTKVFLIAEERRNDLKKKLIKEGKSEQEVSLVAPYQDTDEFIEDCEDVLSELNERYKDKVQEGGLQVLFTFRNGNQAELHCMDIEDCVNSRRIAPIAIGTGSTYARTFLNEFTNTLMTMQEMVKLSYFIIKYIELSKLDNYVGEGGSALFMPHFNDRAVELINKEKTPEEEIELKKYLPQVIDDLGSLFPEANDVVVNFKNEINKLKSKFS